ncbi:MAG: glycine cleavage system aminomethyltransferase GcvT, partial [Dehalococcoidia bacterium]
AGWEMPVQYVGIVEEHHAVRQSAGMFDVSHMGRFEVVGPEASPMLRRLSTYDVARLSPGRGHYAVVCREDGGILDDIYVFRLSPQRFLVVANAANAERIRDWLLAHRSPFRAEVVDCHLSTAMVAVQGPEAVARAAAVIGETFAGSVPKRGCGETEWEGETLFASRTGYTGEDGFELVVPAGAGPTLWRRLLDVGVQPCGLGARDTLRLEAALLLYGNDMDEHTNPYEVGLGWVVSLDDGADFIGREALVRAREATPQRLLVCLRALERGVMRAGCTILHSGQQVGKVSSGGFSPTLGVSIGLGFVAPDLAAEGTGLVVEVRGRPLPAQVVSRPFYRQGMA